MVLCRRYYCCTLGLLALLILAVNTTSSTTTVPSTTNNSEVTTSGNFTTITVNDGSDPLVLHQRENVAQNESDSRSKVVQLGEILKKKVEMLQSQPDRKLDIVFLVDASSSVGTENFISELKFVKKLLADFTISQNETRVAVITFSDEDKVVRHIDHISVPSAENHKCNMLHSDLPNIKYSGGMTYTLGALVEAQSVLEWSRAGAQKAVFLLTDGFSNGGDPAPVARFLKDNGTYIFTFGIQSGNVIELEYIASSPAKEFSYFVDSFDQFEAVVRRALHQDLSVGSYQLLNNTSPCDSLCPDTEKGSRGCCDSQAHCSCGTGSGHYRCLCKPGYYGSGLKDSCKSCPNGTYSNGQIPGDESVCAPCPDHNHITEIGSASSKASCICKRGFFAHGDLCEVITCPSIYPPEHGYFVKRGMCPNVFNAACGVRCKAGYTLHGSSIRLCLENGTWSGKAPKCIVKMCPNPEMPLNGDVKCSLESAVSNDLLDVLMENTKALLLHYAVDTECQFTCKPGHILVGSRRRHCLPLARWDGLRTVCKPITCRPLPKVSHGVITPASCTDATKLPHGQKCDITCDAGYKLAGPASRKCFGKGGQWSMKSNPNKCIDEQPPTIICPANIQTTTDPGEAFATVVIPQLAVSDNSGKTPITWSQPTISSPIKVHIGVIYITFIAMDPSRNQATCNMSVSVIDNEPPVIESCISPNHIHLLETRGNNTVSWMEPEFYDNSGQKPHVTTSHSFGEFPIGRTEVTVVATDESGNNSTCVLEIVLEDSLCSKQPPKIPNAAIVCNSNGDTLINCSMTCHEGFAFDTSSFGDMKPFSLSDDGSLFYSCPAVKHAENTHFVAVSTLPQCGETLLPNSVSQEGEMTFIASKGACKDTELISQVKNTVELELSQRSQDLCNDATNLTCHIVHTNASCEAIVSIEEEETNTIHHSKQSFSSLTESLLLSAPHSHYQTRLRRRETIAVSPRSNINVNFKVVSHLKKKKPNTKHPEMNGFHQLKDSLNRATISLPSNVSQQTLHWKGKEVVECPDGSVPHRSGLCVKCPPGSYFLNTSHKCLPCPRGKYQILDGQSTCLACPRHMSTKYEGSQSVRDCLNLCQPGSYGHTIKSDLTQTGVSVSPCSLCNPGSYQANYGASSCLPCPSGGGVGGPGLHSYKKGAKSTTDCMKLTGKNRWSPPTYCPSHLCQNGGSCRLISLGFVSCDCLPGFYGSVCELSVDDCSSNPCLNGGQCSKTNSSGYECRCPSGYYGHNCEEATDECTSHPCLNNSTCEESSNGYFCDCQDGYQGPRCEENVNDCINNPCGDHGLCMDSVAKYQCSCNDGYSGHHCEIEPADPCSVDSSCFNGGSCLSLNTSMYRCICPSGWEGDHCDIEHDGCSSSPCRNGGTCIKKRSGKYLCRCTISFAGDVCQTSLESDFVLYMHSPSVTDYSIVDFPSQNITEMTACLWLQSKDGFNYGTAFSYATKNQFNSLTLTDYNGFVLYVNGNRVVTDVYANDGLWHHICVLWQSHHGLWSIYLDGLLRDNGSNLSPNYPVLGGGKLVLGQEQDSLGGSFSEAESLIGRIHRLNVWDYILEPPKITTLARECQQNIDGSIVKWSDFLPRIHGKIKVENSTFCSECPPPSPLWHGTVSLIKGDNETIALYECENGFVMYRSEVTMIKRRCLKQGSWEGDSPVCVRRSCGFPGYLPGGTFVGRSFLYTDSVKYLCHIEDEIAGNATRICQADGRWSGEPPTCKGRECPPLGTPKHGDMVMGKNANGIETAFFSCEDGFHLDGARILTCMYDGVWDETVPDCVHNLCPAPPEIEHAYHKNNSVKLFVFMDKVQYECETGFEMLSTSPGIIQCGRQGEWYSYSPHGSHVPMPRCEQKGCSEPASLARGMWVLKNSSINNTSQHYFKGSVLTAKCESDYYVFGPKTIHCQDKSWWPLDITQCVKITCETDNLPFDLPFSVLHLTGEEVGDAATLSCKTGHVLSYAKGNTSIAFSDFSAELVPGGSVRWICKSTGSWIMNNSGPMDSRTDTEWLACLPQAAFHCNLPKAPDFGYILADKVEVKNPVGTTIEVRCRPGFWLDGSSSSVCGKNGKWLGSAVCKPVQCRSLPYFPNMFIASTTAVGQIMEFGNMVTFKCKPGFQTHGDLSVRCQSTGTWSSMRGKCLAL